MQVAKTKRDRWCYVLYCALWGILAAFCVVMAIMTARAESKQIKMLSDGTIPAYAGDSGPVVTAGAGAVPEEGEDTMERNRDCKCGRCEDG